MMFWIEPLFTVIPIAVCVVRRKSALFVIFMAFYLCMILLFRDYQSTPLDILLSHSFALLHIVVSWISKISIICAVIYSIVCQKIKKRWINICIIFQSLSIIFGMFWAFDAPEWGSLWQWDGIETLSLCTLATLMLWRRSGECAHLPALATFLIVVIQNIALYGFGMDVSLSRHSYVQMSQNHILWIAGHGLWFVAVCMIGYFRRRRVV